MKCCQYSLKAWNNPTPHRTADDLSSLFAENNALPVVAVGRRMDVAVSVSRSHLSTMWRHTDAGHHDVTCQRHSARRLYRSRIDESSSADQAADRRFDYVTLFALSTVFDAAVDLSGGVMAPLV